MSDGDPTTVRAEPHAYPDEAPARARSASAALADLGAVLTGPRVSLGALFDALGDAGLGLTLLMLALPSFVPIPGLPTGVIFGAALAVVALQVLVGADRLVLPDFMRRWSLPRDPVVGAARHIAPWLRRVEWLLKPRLPHLAGRTAHVVLAVPIFVHAVMILLPIPLGNQLPALAVIAFAFGLIERDGLAILAGAVLSVVALLWNGAIVFFGAELGLFLYRRGMMLWEAI